MFNSDDTKIKCESCGNPLLHASIAALVMITAVFAVLYATAPAENSKCPVTEVCGD